MRLVKLTAGVGTALLCLGLLGVALANAWYNDDACTIKEYQCALGSAGLTAALVLTPTGALLLAGAGVAALIAAIRDR